MTYTLSVETNSTSVLPTQHVVHLLHVGINPSFGNCSDSLDTSRTELKLWCLYTGEAFAVAFYAHIQYAPFCNLVKVGVSQLLRRREIGHVSFSTKCFDCLHAKPRLFSQYTIRLVYLRLLITNGSFIDLFYFGVIHAIWWMLDCQWQDLCAGDCMGLIQRGKINFCSLHRYSRWWGFIYAIWI